MQWVTAILFLHGAACQHDVPAAVHQELAYDTQRRFVTLPFEAPVCPHLGLDMMGQDEIPVTRRHVGGIATVTPANHAWRHATHHESRRNRLSRSRRASYASSSVENNLHLRW